MLILIRVPTPKNAKRSRSIASGALLLYERLILSVSHPVCGVIYQTVAGSAALTLDGQVYRDIDQDDRVVICSAGFKAKFARCTNKDFFTVFICKKDL